MVKVKDHNNEVTLSKTQMETLCKMLAESHIKGGLIAQQGTNMTAFGGLTRKEAPWIIDSGASDHMTHSENLFSSYVPSSSNQKVRIGSVKEFFGLYYFEVLPSMSSHIQVVMNKSLSRTENFAFASLIRSS